MIHPETNAERIEYLSGRIEVLVGQCEAFPPPARDEALELLRLVIELHGDGLRRLFEAAAAAPHLEAAVAAWGRDPAIGGLVALHGLELPRRTAAATAAIAPPPGFVPVEALTAHAAK